MEEVCGIWSEQGRTIELYFYTWQIVDPILLHGVVALMKGSAIIFVIRVLYYFCSPSVIGLPNYG